MTQLLIHIAITALILFSVGNIATYYKINKEIKQEFVDIQAMRSESIKSCYKLVNRVQSRLHNKVAA
jgi:isocitrate dehydrogenase kinase/phosphatase